MFDLDQSTVYNLLTEYKSLVKLKAVDEIKFNPDDV